MNTKQKITSKNLNDQANELSNILSNPNHIIENKDLQEYINYLVFFLKLMNYEIDVEVSFSQEVCNQCFKVFKKRDIRNPIYLTCNKHVLCSKDCAVEFVKACTENNILNWKYAQCFRCFTPLDRKFFESIYGPAFAEMLKKAEEDKEPKFTCDICLTEWKIKECITLPCDHRFCKVCIKAHLETNINEAKVLDEDLTCPQGDKAPIDINIIKYTVEPEIFQKYERFAMERWTPQLENGEIDFHCKGTDCNFRIILEDNLEEYECPKCKHKSCPKCNEETHKGSSCEAFKKWKEENEQADEKFDALVRDSQWVACPWCKQIIERTTGCQYMACTSIVCRGKKFFCFNCKQGLAFDHQAHQCFLR